MATLTKVMRARSVRAHQLWRQIEWVLPCSLDTWKSFILDYTCLGRGRVVQRHPDRENQITLYLEEHLGAADVKILLDHPSREIVFYADPCVAARGIRLSGRSSSALR